MPQPRISVLLPTRDGGAHLQEAVASILGQTFSDFELLVIDDHTTDGSVGSLNTGDPRIRVIANRGTGIVDALNTGADRARGELLARMDDDDIALSQRFERQAAFIDQHSEIGIVGAQVEIFHDHSSVGEGYRLYEAWINELVQPQQIARSIYIESPIPHPTALMRRSVFERLGGYRDTAWAEDYDLWLRANAMGIAMGKPPGVLLRWRDHEKRLSRTGSRYAVTQFLRAKAYYLARTHLEIRDTFIWGAGETGKLLHDALLEQGVGVKGFIDVDPLKIGGRKRGLPVFSYQDCSELDGVIVVAVGARGARRRIADALHKQSLIEGCDYIFAA